MTELQVSVMIEEAVDEAMTQHEEKMKTFIKAEFGQLHSLITAAFPNGDVHGHKLAHEAQIDNAKWWQGLKADFISKAFTTGMLGGIGFVLIATWEHFKNEVKK